MERRVRKAVIPAAGLGTRFLPATKAQPKEMLPLVDKPIIQYVVEEAVASGIEDILIITGRGKRPLEDHFDRHVELEQRLAAKNDTFNLTGVKDIAELADIYFVRQKEPLGLGHAVLTARKHIGNEPFAVLLGDEVFTGHPPCMKQLVQIYERSTAQAVVGVQSVRWKDVSRYGIVAGEPFGENGLLLRQLVEKPPRELAPSNMAIIGRYVLPPDIFDILAHMRPGYGGEMQLTDALRDLTARSEVLGFEITGSRFDVGDKMGFLKATVEFALSRPDLAEEFMAFLTSTVYARTEANCGLEREAAAAKDPSKCRG